MRFVGVGISTNRRNMTKDNFLLGALTARGGVNFDTAIEAIFLRKLIIIIITFIQKYKNTFGEEIHKQYTRVTNVRNMHILRYVISF